MYHKYKNYRRNVMFTTWVEVSELSAKDKVVYSVYIYMAGKPGQDR